MKTTRILVLALLAAVVSACGTGPGPDVRRGAIENALSGDFGDVSVSDDHRITADITRYTGEWGSLNILLTAPNAQNGAVMGGVFISNLDLDTLPIGTRIHATQSWGYDEPFLEADAMIAQAGTTIQVPGGDPMPADDIWVDGIGCSGDDPGNWVKDEPAEEIIIEVIEGEEGERGVVVILDFANDADNLEATAVLENITEYEDDYLIEPAVETAGLAD